MRAPHGAGMDEKGGNRVSAADNGSGENGAANPIAPEDHLRANMYGLLAALLRERPNAEMLEEIAALSAGDNEMGRACAALAEAARDGSFESVDDEYHALFTGVGESELQPYASYYLTGFLHEKPLANLRVTMEGLGIARAEGVAEPEDHIAALCEMMCGMIAGAFDGPVDLYGQRNFFDDHIAPWAERFFEDLEAAPDAHFYRPVGTIGRLFMRIESQAFQMAA